jgi:hypothetical protein
MTDPEHDEEFEAYLRRHSALSSRVQSEEKLEPPHDLDDIVLRKARQAIQAPQQLPLYKAPRWALPVALAATILLCFSIWLNVSINMHRPPAVSSRLAPAPAPLKPAAPQPNAEVILPEAKVVAPHATPTPTPSTSDAQSRVAAAPVPPPAADTQAQSPSAALAMRQSAALPPSRDPKAWLKRIDALRAAGETARADAELSRFRAAFPAYPVHPLLPPVSKAPK